MSFRKQLASAKPGRETVLAVGVFDGVHLGHRHVLQQLRQLAGDRYLPAAVTFINHPLPVLRPGTQVSYITTPEEKVHLLQEQGVALVVSLEFTRALSQVSARDFTTMLVDLLRMKGLVMGPDSTVGHNREGDVAFLRKLGAKLGFWVETVEPLLMDGERVRSRRIREAIQGGDMEKGCQLLGRPFSLQGSVVRGDGRGRELGFPTANLAVGHQMVLPADAIYATWTIIAGKRHPSATSIGIRPTFGLTQRVVEVYVLDYDADLYGQEIRVEFVHKLRDQETFPTVADLVKQIDQDVANARLALAHAGGVDLA